MTEQEWLKWVVRTVEILAPHGGHDVTLVTMQAKDGTAVSLRCVECCKENEYLLTLSKQVPVSA